MKFLLTILAVVLVLSMVVCLAACGQGSSPETTAAPETAAPDEQTEEETTEAETEPETEPYVAQYSGNWELMTDEESGTKYWKLDAVYVQNPIKGKTTSGPEKGVEGVFDISDDGYIQHIAVFAPESYMTEGADGVTVNPEGSVASSTGITYTAANAPVVLRNYSGGYTSSTIKGVNIDFINDFPCGDILTKAGSLNSFKFLLFRIASCGLSK